MMAGNQSATTLQDFFSNTVILRQFTPYLPIQSLIALTAVCRDIRDVLQHEPQAFRRVDLSNVKKAKITTVPIDVGGRPQRQDPTDQNLTEDEFVSGPIRWIFNSLQKKNVLENVRTLILDGMGITWELVDEIIKEDRFNVQLLSIRGCELNERKLMQTFEYAVRPTRQAGMPKLKALYFFGPKGTARPQVQGRGTLSHGHGTDASQETGIMSSEGAQLGTSWNEKSRSALTSSMSQCEDRWYHPAGKVAKVIQSVEHAWADTLRSCESIIAFDAVLCRGPRHDIGYRNEKANIDDRMQGYLRPTIASIALGSGCQKCGTMPEHPAVYPHSPTCHLPLLEPPPLHSSTVREAQRPHLVEPSSPSYPPLFVRCLSCLKGRWCERCLKWWCEDCYSPEEAGRRSGEVGESSSLPTRRQQFRLFMGLCVEDCLVGEMMAGAGSNGMWG